MHHLQAMGNEGMAEICGPQHWEAILLERGTWNPPPFRSSLGSHRCYPDSRISAFLGRKTILFGRAFRRPLQRRTKSYTLSIAPSHAESINYLIESGLTTLSNWIQPILVKATRRRNGSVVINSIAAIYCPIVVAEIMHSTITTIVNEPVLAQFFV